MIPMTAVTRESLEAFVFDVLRAMGLPEEVAHVAESHTGRYLREALGV